MDDRSGRLRSLAAPTRQGALWLDGIESRRPTLVFAFAFDEALNADVKALPGRRFDWQAREWRVPGRPEVAVRLRDLLARHAWLRVAPEVTEWLAGSARWHGSATATSVDGAAAFLVWTDGGTTPERLRGAARGEHDGAAVLPLNRASARLLGELRELRLDDGGRACVEALLAGETPAAGTLQLAADLDDEPLIVLEPGWDRSLVSAFRALPEARIHAWRGGRQLLADHAQELAVPADAALVPALDAGIGEQPGLRLGPAAARALGALRAEHARASATVALSLAHDAALELEGLGGTLEPFQRAGVRYALRQRRTFIADEQGLGKTVQALAVLEADDAFPAVVVCPASMKLTWQAEAQRWLPHRRVAVLNGRSTQHEGLDDAELIVANYEILDAQRERLAARGLRAAVFDESHYCKEPRAKRTKAAIALADRVTPNGLRLALTGTPILNHPRELVSQLRVIGRLRDLGSGAGLSRRFDGPQALERLHWHLRAHGYVRRTKAEVLPQLPAKRTVTVPLALTNEAEYRLAEEDVVAWLRSQPLDLRTLDARVAAALRSERLAQLNTLRQLAGQGKLRAALGWLDDFLASGEALVLFADHRLVQRAVLERHPEAAHVLGDDSAVARDRAVRAFQDPDGPRLIVCSLRAASLGLTLSRASNVCFLELDWTPARLDQAEDRCHRIGQRDAVTAWYLVAPETIDETMATLLARKRGVIGAVTDGRPAEDEALVAAVVRELRGRRRRHLRAVA